MGCSKQNNNVRIVRRSSFIGPTALTHNAILPLMPLISVEISIDVSRVKHSNQFRKKRMRMGDFLPNI